MIGGGAAIREGVLSDSLGAVFTSGTGAELSSVSSARVGGELDPVSRGDTEVVLDGSISIDGTVVDVTVQGVNVVVPGSSPGIH